MSNTVILPTDGFAIDPQFSDSVRTNDTLRGNVGRLSLRIRGGWRVPYSITSPTAWIQVPAADIALVDNATNYIEVSAAGVISTNTVGFTVGASALYQVTVSAAGLVTAIVDARFS